MKGVNRQQYKNKYKNINYTDDSWDVYTVIDFVVATFLVVISMGNAEPPRFGSFARQTSPERVPYVPTGWRPQGAAFTLPERQNYGPPPVAYGPPQTYGPPEVTTTELPTTTDSTTEEIITEEPQAESFMVSANNRQPTKLREESQQPKQEQPGGAYYFVLPQTQNLVYSLQQSAPLVAYPRTNVYTTARLQTVPVSDTRFYNPYSESLVQIYQ